MVHGYSSKRAEMRAIFFKLPSINSQNRIFFNDHTTMASIDDESELSEAQSTVTTPFSIVGNLPEIDLEEAFDQ